MHNCDVNTETILLRARSVTYSSYKCIKDNKAICFKRHPLTSGRVVYKTCSTAIFKPSSPLLQLLISLGVHLTWQYNLSRLTQLFKREVFYICLVTLNFSFIFRKTASVLTCYCLKKTNRKCIMLSPQSVQRLHSWTTYSSLCSMKLKVLGEET